MASLNFRSRCFGAQNGADVTRDVDLFSLDLQTFSSTGWEMGLEWKYMLPFPLSWMYRHFQVRMGDGIRGELNASFCLANEVYL